MIVRMKKLAYTALLLLAVMFSISAVSLSSYGQTFNYKTSEGSSIVTGRQVMASGFPITLTTWCNEWPALIADPTTWGDDFKFKSLHSFLKFQVNHAHPFQQYAYTYQLTYSLYGYYDITDTTLYHVHNDTLTISNTSFDNPANAFQDINLVKFSNYYKTRVVITGIYNNDYGVITPIDLADTMRINYTVESSIQSQRYDKMVSSNTYYGRSGSTLELTPVPHADKNYLTVFFNFSSPDTNAIQLTPVNYELEWTFVDDYTTDLATGAHTQVPIGDLNYDFSHNCTRVWLNENRYNIPVTYPSGYLVYRMRMVRPDSLLFRYPVYSDWSYATPNSGSISSLNSNAYYNIANPYTGDSLNWQYTISFAEGGKYKHVVSFFDGLLKNRESITRFNSDPSRLIVAKSIYDFEGRPSISILPTPVPDAAFNFVHDVDLNSATSLPYKAGDFDTLVRHNCPSEPYLSPLATNARASVYYSPYNPDSFGVQKFVPDAEGYPLTHTIFSPAFNDRVEKQGGAGPRLQIADSNILSMRYVAPGQGELDRYFGMMAGFSGFYNKTVVRDPNMQKSVTVKDYKGRQVFSAYSGRGLKPDDHATMATDAPDSIYLHEDFLAGLPQTIFDHHRIADGPFDNDAEGTVTFQYVYEYRPLKVCDELYLNIGARYNYAVTDQCGDTVVAEDSVICNSGISTSPTTFYGTIHSVNLPEGKYDIHKELVFRDDSVAWLIDQVLNSPLSCLLKEPYFIKKSVKETAFPCVADDECTVLRKKLKEELHPGAKYGVYHAGSGPLYAVGNGNSIFDVMYLDTVVNGDGSYIRPHYRYQDTCTMASLPDTITTGGIFYGNLRTMWSDSFIDVYNQSIIDDPNDPIAEALLPLHPEYCKLQRCLNDTFASRLMAIDSFAIADSLHLLYLDSIYANDPMAPFLAAEGYPADSILYYSGGHIRLDSFLYQQVYCGCGDSVMQHECVYNLYEYEIQHKLLVNDFVKHMYFDNIVDLYIGNRQHFIDLWVNRAGDSCMHCANVRMELTPLANFTLTDPAGGLVPPMLLDSAWTGDAHAPWLLSAFAGMPGAGTPAMDSFLLVMHDSATALYASSDSMLCSGRVETIMTHLANCGSGDTAILNTIRNTLDSMCAAHAVSMGGFTPDQVRYAIVRGGAALNDFCNQYMIACDFTAPGLSSGQNCLSDSFYRSMTAFFNRTSVLDAYRTPGTTHLLTLNAASNLFEAELEQVLGDSHAGVKASWSSIDTLYKLIVYRDPAYGTADSVRIYLRGTGGCGNVFSLGDSISVYDIACVNTLTTPPAMGFVKQYSFVADAVYYEHDISGLHAYICSMLGWNDTVKTMSLINNVIAECVPCTQMRSLFTEFTDSMTAFGVHGGDHPFYDDMLRNFMNYKVRKVFGSGQYQNFIESCALADSMTLPLYYGYAALNFINNDDADSFLARFNRVNMDYYFEDLFRTRDGTGAVSMFMDFENIPRNKMWLYKKFIDTFSSAALALTNVAMGGSSDLLGVFYAPVGTAIPSAASLFGSGTTISVISNGTQGVWDWDHYSNRDMYALQYVPGTTTPWEISLAVYELERYMYNNPDLGIVFNNYYRSTINAEFFTQEKAKYLLYTYGYRSLPPYMVLDSVQAQYLEARIPLYNGRQPQYPMPGNPNVVTNLYMADSTVNYDHAYILGEMLTGIYDNSPLGPNHLFHTPSYLDFTGDSSLVAIRCADNSYLYLYFGAADTLWTMFVSIPAWVPTYTHPQYVVSGGSMQFGDSTTRFFNLNLERPGDNLVVHARCMTSFIVGHNMSLHDVLLGNPLTSAGSYAPIPDTFANCEHDKLNAAIARGQDLYREYIDSATNAIRASLLAQQTDSIVEHLYKGYLIQQFGVTLYYYDRAGNLVQTVSPGGVNPLDTGLLYPLQFDRNHLNFSNIAYYPFHAKTSVYRYDTRNLLTSKWTPDGGYAEYHYDDPGRLIFSRNSKQQASNDFIYTYNIYDKQNRIVETGEQLGDKTEVYDLYNNNRIDDLMATFRQRDRRDVVVTIYDTEALDLSTINAQDRQENLRKRVACTKYFDSLYVPDSVYLNYTYATHYSYDIDGSVKTLTQDFPLLDSVNQRYKRIDYDYDMISGKVNMLSYNRSFADQYYQRYNYDADNRLTKVETSSDGYIWHRDAEYTYYQHGPLARTELGDMRVQGIDYAYTIQGWLKAVNGDTANKAFDMGRDGDLTINANDAVGFTLNYFKDDYKAITANAVSSVEPQLKNLYDGNIARQTIAYTTDSGRYIFPRYTRQYLYDQMSRLRNADYGYVSATDNTITQTREYHNDYTYDPDGNLKTLNRYSFTKPPAAGPQILDSFNYYYYSGNNTLSALTDEGFDMGWQDVHHQTDSTILKYMYDPTGNTIKDLVAGQDSIEWNLYNKVTHARNIDGATSMRFKYDAMGNRVAKTVTVDDGAAINSDADYYVRDAKGNILATYHEVHRIKPGENQRYFSLAGHDIYGSARLGVKNWWPMQVGEFYNYALGVYDTVRLRERKPWYSLEYQDVVKHDQLQPYGNTLNTQAFATHLAAQKQYELTDHLGNVLATVADVRKTNGTPTLTDTFKIVDYSPAIKSLSDYFPFGMLMPARHYEDVSGYTTTVTQTMLAPQLHTTRIEWNDGNATAVGTASISGSSTLKLTAFHTNDGLTYTIHPVNSGLTTTVGIKVLSVAGTDFIATLAQGGSTTSTHITAPGTSSVSLTCPVSGTATLSITYLGPTTTGKMIEIDYIDLDTFAFVPYTGLAQISSGGNYKYGFNGQIKDDEWAGIGNHLDFKFRGYDSRIGRFSSVDPLTTKYPWNSPYAFAENRVIDGKDLEGCEFISPILAGVAESPVIETVTEMAIKPAANLRPIASWQELSETSVFPGGGFEISPTPVPAPAPAGMWSPSEVAPFLLPYIPPAQDNLKRVTPTEPEVEKNKIKTITLYRGVHAEHPDLPNAKRGMAVPTGGHSDPVRHNQGDNNSIYTSWTIYKSVAEKFGGRKGKGGVILKKEFKLTDVVPSIDKWQQGEMLIPGVVTGAQVTPAPPSDKKSN